MHFAAPIPLWAAAILVGALGGLAFVSYRRPLAPLSTAQRGLLMALRVISLVVLLVFLCRPVVFLPARQADVIVPVLVDVSRSMRIADAAADRSSGVSRLTRAVQTLESELLPELSRRFTPVLFGIGDALTPVAPEALGQLDPTARHSDLNTALAAVRDRYRGRAVPGILLLSDGGDTAQQIHAGEAGSGPPVFTVGIGEVAGLRDREVLSVTAGDPRLDQASVDLHVTTVSSGYGRQPYDLQVRSNGQLVESRRITPVADGSPMDETFIVSPDPLMATVFTVNAAAGPDESILENNSHGILVNPAGRKRRLLILAGAPGFEHSFMVRAFSRDPGLEIDEVVRKGKNESGRDTFFVQAGGGRGASLTQGFPARTEDLFAYDAVIIANIEGDFFTQSQLTTVADFVGERGGGVLVLGGRSFSQKGLIGTPLEDVLPVELNDRRGGLARASFGVDLSGPRNALVVTPDGMPHPVMRIGATLEETRARWAALPTLAGTAQLGGPRPGASVLAVTSTPAGIYPVIAVQRYGRGRAMIFGGEAAWHWRMMLPSADRTFEFFWRQSARWLAGSAPDPVTVTVPASADPGDSMVIAIEARDARFAPAPDAVVDATLTLPGGVTQPLTVRREAGSSGRFTAAVGLDEPGVYRVRVDARRGSTLLGTADQWFHVGGGHREFADPRLNEGVLRRIAMASGGRYVPVADVSKVVPWLEAAVPQAADPERRDVWNQPWAYAMLIALLSVEWVLRRRWGLR